MHLRILRNKAKTVKEIVWVAPFPKKWRLFGSPWMAKVVPPVNNPWIGGLKLCSQVPFKSSFRKRREGEGFPQVDPGRVCVFFVCLCVKNVFFEVNQMWLSMSWLKGSYCQLVVVELEKSSDQKCISTKIWDSCCRSGGFFKEYTATWW